MLSDADEVVKASMCTYENLKSLLECLVKLQQLDPRHLIKLMRAMTRLTKEHAVVPAIRAADAIAVLVPFLAKEKQQAVAAGQQQQANGAEPTNPPSLGSEVQLEALHALYNICNLYKIKDHIEAASMAGITPHLCRLAREGARACPSSAEQQGQGQRQDQWQQFRTHVVPMLTVMVTCSSGTRAKLWSADGVDVLLLLLRERVRKAADEYPLFFLAARTPSCVAPHKIKQTFFHSYSAV